MNEETALVPDDVIDDRRRRAALIRALGMERMAPEQVELFLAIAKRYDLDPMLKHLVMVDGRPFVTRDGLLWIAHRSGVLDGIEVSEPKVVNLPGVGEFWTCTARVWRKDMSRPFEYRGRYPTKGGNVRYAPEMAVKTAESQALRRAFNISAATIDERFDLSDVQADVDAVSAPAQPPRSLSETVSERRQAVVVAEAVSEPAVEPDEAPGAPGTVVTPDEDDEVTQSRGAARLASVSPLRAPVADPAEVTLDDMPVCGDEDVSPMALGFCELLPGHRGAHRSEHGSWPSRA
jgi:hypothetical protein